jgi:hypothetical protein
LIFYYIYWSIRLRIPPWYYFQINAEWYNREKSFYSKIEMDGRIPEKWRLKQTYLDKNTPPTNFPVFLKPEWGQNSNGIVRADSLDEFQAFDASKSKIPYIVQEVAHELQEYELFYIRHASDSRRLVTLTITRSINNSSERYPINSINNGDVVYQDCTQDFSADELTQLHKHLGELPDFRIARVGLRANSKSDLLSGLFHIIEINLFAPFPINLLDDSVPKEDKYVFIKSNMRSLVEISNTIPKAYFNRFVFIKKIIKHYQSKK